jgi:uncharacterized protein (DUF1778 family)
LAKNEKQSSGGARLIASGRHPVLLGPTEEQHALLAAAAEVDGRPVTQFLIFHGLEAAKKILKKNQDTA